ncbi:hypothetical protein [Bacillus sp. ISL-57]|uniref:hypothetical protein n=1 Tax=Bacillus sp. ISL-57 TaxID=2819135 RepID=UPI001BE881E4|nr:hypothetical protein [Bacillus sp. ISL-57]
MLSISLILGILFIKVPYLLFAIKMKVDNGWEPYIIGLDEFNHIIAASILRCSDNKVKSHGNP